VKEKVEAKVEEGCKRPGGEDGTAETGKLAVSSILLSGSLLHVLLHLCNLCNMCRHTCLACGVVATWQRLPGVHSSCFWQAAAGRVHNNCMAPPTAVMSKCCTGGPDKNRTMLWLTWWYIYITLLLLLLLLLAAAWRGSWLVVGVQERPARIQASCRCCC
jgi:hypothetical protein